MGRKKKVFIDKKNSATFKLLARDSSTFPASDVTSVPAASDRVFVRVDNNPFHVSGSFMDEDDDADRELVSHKGEDGDSIFADAPGDTDDQLNFSHTRTINTSRGLTNRDSRFLPDGIRKEILELGLPDDGYNYLKHLREINNNGAGSAYYENSKARLDLVPLDVKAYDASRVKVTADEPEKNSISTVASKAVNVRVHKVIDPDVARLLDDSDLSRFGSDAEDFEEDFVFKANLPEENEQGNEESDTEERKLWLAKAEEVNELLDEDGEDEQDDGEKPRIHRLLDEQFDLLTLQEYNDDTCGDEDDCLEMEGGKHAVNLHDALKGCKVDDLEVEEQYRVPSDYARKQEELGTGNQFDDSIDVIRRCREYAAKYFNEDEGNEELILVEESSDDSEIWDCETIVSTYSNLDNHPGKIQAPGNPIRKSAKNLRVDSLKKVDMIELRGKEKLPLDFLPHGKKEFEKLKKPPGSEKERSKPRREESKDEKKERKVAVKEEKREVRRAKKELKELYRCEISKALKVVAVSLPPAVHLM
ncbi:hypothetical protein KSP39_PZI010352 [Platanthera zijinensis]|uniref:Low temperature viability protein n=1 Tax=Platanthera zijinensis TaxID=2320716 RepID=A0AAP0G748_9ASPA